MMKHFRTALLSAGVTLTIPQCVTPEPEAPSLSVAQVTRLLPTDLKSRDGWAQDIVAGIESVDKAATAERVCAVIAIIQQESGFNVDPSVANLPTIVRNGLEQKFAKLGPMSGLAVKAILAGRAPGTKESFGQRIDKLKTESDLDRLFRDIADSYRERFPGSVLIASAVAKVMDKGWLEDLNPVTTAGSMQVKVSYAKELKGLSRQRDEDVRDTLYTREGGIRAGVARLLDYEASYDDIVYRFADYNAGLYASRNSAFQSMLGEVTGRTLVLDGDLLAYEPDGSIASGESKTVAAMQDFGSRHGISPRAVRSAAKDEKSKDFEDSDMWDMLRSQYEKKMGKKPIYARMPNVTFESPKLGSKRSTEWFAKSVKKRYSVCRAK